MPTACRIGRVRARSAGATQIDENPFDDIDQLVSDALDAPSSSEEDEEEFEKKKRESLS